MEATEGHPHHRTEDEIRRMLFVEGDPEDPQNWPLHKKLHACITGWTFTFVLLFGLTSYSVAIPAVGKEFPTSDAILPFSLYLFGIFFAPIYTPHLSEMVGRFPVYCCALPLLAAFEIGAGYSQTFAQLCVCRFFAGFFGGPSIVLIEGTFADVWDDRQTGTYYIFLTTASYSGAAFGPLISAFVVANENWRWAQYVTAMLALAAILISVGTPETYPRQVVRSIAKREGRPSNLPPADSGTTLSRMATLTLFRPAIMLVSEPLVTAIALALAFNFGVLFQFFITVPVVLQKVYDFSLEHIGLSLLGPIGGIYFALATVVVWDQITFRAYVNKPGSNGHAPIEHRLVPAILGGTFMWAGLFWVGWTAKPTVSVVAPIMGVFFFVWGSTMHLAAFVSYLFDAYRPANTLAALTAGATTRAALAGVIPLVVLQMFNGLTPPWALGTFGFIGIALSLIPILLFMFGAKLRAHSPYSEGGKFDPSDMGSMSGEGKMLSEPSSNA